MKQSNSDLESVAKKFSESHAAENSASENPHWNYAKALRTLGQALEAHQISTVDLEIESGVYFVRGKATTSKSSQESLGKLIRDFVFGAGSDSTREESHDVTLRYTTNEIQQLDGEGQAKRADDSKTPDPYSLSQVLRGAGAYLDNRQETALVGITVKERWVTLRYRTPEGRLEQAKEDIEYFFNYWVKMYLRRRSRAKLAAVSDPTLVVTWEGIKKHNPTY